MNAVLAPPLHRVRAAYLSTRPELRGRARHFEGTVLEGNVPAVLEGIAATKFQIADRC